MTHHDIMTAYESRLRERPSVRPDVARVALSQERLQEIAVDETLDESFPASDPPSWNSGIARPMTPI